MPSAAGKRAGRAPTGTHGSGSADGDLAARVIGAAFEVANTLGSGFLEKVYENALVRGLGLTGILAEQQQRVEVIYKGGVVGHYIADLLVERSLIVEIKVAEAIGNDHIAQTLNYMRATGLKAGLILNFGRSKVEFRRVLGDNFQ